MSKMSKSGKLVGFLDTKDQAKKASIWLLTQDKINLKLIDYLKVNFVMLWRSWMITKFLMI